MDFLGNFYKKLNISFFSDFRKSWKLLVIITLLFFLVGIFIDGYIFFQFNQSAPQEEPAAISKMKGLNAKAFDEVSDYFKEKESLFKKNLGQKPKISDPSR